MITKKQKQALKAIFPPEQHEWRVMYKTDYYVYWSVYVRRYSLINRLDDLFDDWHLTFSDEIHRTATETVGKQTKQVSYVDVTAHLTINGITRSDKGTGKNNGEYGAKSAYTDAFKRACIYHGMGLYLQNAPDFRTKNDGNKYPDKSLVEAQIMGWLHKINNMPYNAPQPQPTPQNKSLLPDGMQTTTPFKGTKWTQAQEDAFKKALEANNVTLADFMYQNYPNVKIRAGFSQYVPFKKAMSKLGGA